jgi:2-dehydro-3-deoxy-D-arabinonate dehydratase
MHPLLTRHATPSGPRWAIDGRLLPDDFTLASWLAAPTSPEALRSDATTSEASGALLPPIEPTHEVWASGVTYLSSRMAREAESQSRDVYQKVYAAERPELFFKSTGWRVRGHGHPIRIRADSSWNVPEPELTLVLDAAGDIVGYTVGNDVSSRSIEGENPLYLPQAKVYDGGCALGPGIALCGAAQMRDLPIRLDISRAGSGVFGGETRSSQIKRGLAELAGYLFRELAFPHGAFLLTGTGVVPGEDFTLRSGDVVRISIDGLTLENPVQ